MRYLLIILISCLLFSKIKVGDRVEEIIYPDGKKVVNLLQNNKYPFYRVDKERIKFNKFKKIKSKYGYIYLFDLSKNNLFFYGYNFDILKIDGNLSNLKTIAIADEKLFKKDDNFKLPKRKIINLKELFKKIDLSKLKYFVAISDNNISPIKEIEFIKTKRAKKAIIALWIWKSKPIEKEKLKNYKAKRVYIQIDKNFKNGIQKLKDSNITIFGLNGDPKAIYNITPFIKNIQLLSKLKKIYPNIKGYQVDIEPYLLKEFKKDRVNILIKYLNSLKKLKDESKKANLKLSIVIPFWFDNIYINNKNLAFNIVDIADEVAIMSYRSSIKDAIKLSKNILNYANYAKKDILIGLECMKIDNEEHRIYKVKKVIKNCLIEDKMLKECKELDLVRKFTLKGNRLSFYNQLEKLKKLPYIKVDEESFKGFILHFYSILPAKAPY